MSLKVGIVGLPNVGKSTLFNALLKKQLALVANYPFATIEPNMGVVEVPDERLSVLAKIVNTNKKVYATVEFVDIAGLVAGASTGAGLGNKFLSHIREVDVIVQVLRGFEDSNVVKEGAVDPESDYKVIGMELALKDLEIVGKILGSRESRILNLESRMRKLEILHKGLNEGRGAREVLSEEELTEIQDLGLLTAKREIKVLNVGEMDPRLREDDNSDTVVICAKVEAELAEFGEEEAKSYLAGLGLTESGLDRLIKKAYETLGLISFLTAGEIECRAWTIKAGTKAPQAAAVIHTDFEKKFIRARVCSYEDFVECGGWKNVAEKGKLRVEGKEYVMKEGDVVEFLIGS